MTLEAEDFTLFNVNGDTEPYKMGITNGSAGAWDEGATYINAFEPGDYISVPYTAKAGTYEVKAIYSSGSATKSLYGIATERSSQDRCPLEIQMQTSS